MHRLKKMNFSEIIHRVKVSKYEQNLKKEYIDKRIKSESELGCNKFNSIYIDKVNDNIIKEAEFILKDNFLVFDEYINIDSNLESKYITHPFNKVKTPINFFKDINYRELDGSPKAIWEINKQYFLLQLAIAYKKTNNDIFLIKCESEMSEWVDDNKKYETINWCSNLEMSIRNINWIFTLSLIGEYIKPELKERLLDSMASQANFIMNRLSLYSSANNHLIGEITFLLLASYFLRCDDGKKWRKVSLKLLNEQIENQFYNDGINKEQSINYQLHTMEFYILSMIVLKENGENVSPTIEKLIKKSLEYINDISESNGWIFNIGDQDSGNIIKISSRDNEILDILHLGAVYYNDKNLISTKKKYFSNKAYFLLGEDYVKFSKEIYISPTCRIERIYEEGGAYYVKRKLNNKWCSLYIDYGTIGMAPLYAHAHSDILSFNLNISEKPIFTDMGTYTYDMKEGWRDYFRGSSAHNTIKINGKNQFEFLGPFMCDISPKSRMIKESENIIEFETEAYKKEGCTIKRKFSFFKDYLEIEDNINSHNKLKKNIEVFFNLDSNVIVEEIERNIYILKREDIELEFSIDKRLEVNIYKGYIDNGEIAGFQSRKYNQIESCFVIKCNTKSIGLEKIIYKIKER